MVYDDYCSKLTNRVIVINLIEQTCHNLIKVCQVFKFYKKKIICHYSAKVGSLKGCSIRPENCFK